MATKLPKISIPTYSDSLVSNGEPFRYRAFLVGEESKLLLLKEGMDDTTNDAEVYEAVKELVESCTMGELDVSVLPRCDIEWIFLKLRMKSVGEVIELVVNHDPQDEQFQKCKHKQKIDVNLNDLKVRRREDVSSQIIVDNVNNIGVQLRYPTYNDMKKLSSSSKSDIAISLIKTCTEYIYQGEEVFYLADFSDAEVDEFFKSCSTLDNLKKFVEFFDSEPKVIYDLYWTCDKCGGTDGVQLEGLQTFL